MFALNIKLTVAKYLSTETKPLIKYKAHHEQESKY